MKNSLARLVPWYLMLSYLYYKVDNSHVSDAMYDYICNQLNKHWDKIEHRHKHLIDRDQLSAGTGYYLKFDEFPTIIKTAAVQALRDNIQPPLFEDCNES